MIASYQKWTKVLSHLTAYISLISWANDFKREQNVLSILGQLFQTSVVTLRTYARRDVRKTSMYFGLKYISAHICMDF